METNNISNVLDNSINQTTIKSNADNDTVKKIYPHPKH